MTKMKIVNGAEVTEIPVAASVTNEQLERQPGLEKRPAPSDAHKYTVGKIKTFRGMEGYGLNAVLLRDGKLAADLLDEGCGGMMHFDWVDMNKGVEEAKFLAFIESERLKIPAGKGSDGFDNRELFDGDIWVWDQANKVLEDRRFARICKKNTVFQVGKDIGGDSFRQIKGVTPEIRAFIEKKYAGQKVFFLNDQYKS